MTLELPAIAAQHKSIGLTIHQRCGSDAASSFYPKGKLMRIASRALAALLLAGTAYLPAQAQPAAEPTAADASCA
ncbi:hypothetical protein [Sandarakinorhabdus limnophila]|uniref:hypothetical protein n=1 Tax=Sandarakinorhabdus limnophila TaxID=210512 RepID=UPI0003B59C8C|nr:hypothetical protein [Sandarakinorhabdus limnophila]